MAKKNPISKRLGLGLRQDKTALLGLVRFICAARMANPVQAEGAYRDDQCKAE
jgi:hypothetical protein